MRVFGQQNPDGDWPQWFMFFPRERNIRPGDSHGDIVFWPLLALAEYIVASGDAGLLEQPAPFFNAGGDDQAEWAPLRTHVERALAVIAARRVPGTGLAAYGHGDWNDSLQPVDPAMRELLCSSWTVTLHFQTLRALAEAWRRIDLDGAAFEREAEIVRREFQSRLLVDGVLVGFAYFHPEGQVDYLVHPRDPDSGIHYSLLPMIHAIVNDMLTPEQAERHFVLIREHLLGPDGARLFDRPLPYRGGPQKYFQRAESSSYFGREIGLMYTHAHLRYAEALARFGDAERFFRALCLVNPIALRELIPAAAPRQANCYYSSSDAVFTDRYQAQIEYRRALRGEIPLEGGWRIYSSGAGIVVRLVIHCLLGLRQEHGRLVFDPVMPRELDGLRAELDFAGRKLEVTYRIGPRGYGPEEVRLNGRLMPCERLENPYRTGGVGVNLDSWSECLATGNRLELRLG
jgi:cellobiose phosphorylase